MSRRALTRNCRLQTGLSLAVWRQQARLEAASARLRMGEPVTRVAYEVGYESVATFSMIFRQNFGTTPSQYARSGAGTAWRSEEHTSELQSLMRMSYAVFCLKKTQTSATINKPPPR